MLNNNKNKFVYILFSYLKVKLKIIFIFLSTSIIFLTVFYLYNIQLQPILYACLLSLFFLIIYASYDFYKFFYYHKALEVMLINITISIENFPETKSLIEKDYQNIIIKLFDEKCNLISQSDVKYSDMIDYYTLWAHQIKTPISAMKLILQSNHFKRNKELNLELFKIERYVEMVLQYLRIESMSSDLVLKEYNIENIIKQAVRKYSVFFITKKIKLELKQINCKVITDEKWLVFVIEQILSNSLKYTKEGIITIYMSEYEENVLIIEDTGIGIQNEDLPRIFERGFTGYNGRIDKKSTGIGLYLCKKILNKLSYEIKITSSIGIGTKVYINLNQYKLNAK